MDLWKRTSAEAAFRGSGLLGKPVRGLNERGVFILPRCSTDLLRDYNRVDAIAEARVATITSINNTLAPAIVPAIALPSLAVCTVSS